MTMRPPVRIIEARTGEIKWNLHMSRNAVEDAHISHLYDRGEVDLRRLSERKAAEVVEYMAAHESINKAANACITLTDEEIELLTNYAELNGDEASYLRVLCFMLKEGLYDNCVLWLPMTRNLRAGINDTDTEVYDRSPFGNHGAIHGAVWQTLPSGKSALSFDGVDDFVNCGNDESIHLDGKDFTITAWVKPEIQNKYRFIYHKWRPNVFITNDEKRFTFEIDDGEYKPVHIYTSIQNKWYFLVQRVKQNQEHKAWVFDESGLIGTALRTDIGTTQGSDGSSFRLSYFGWFGGGEDVNAEYKGLIDEVLIYNRALSEEEIKRLYELTRVFYGV